MPGAAFGEVLAIAQTRGSPAFQGHSGTGPGEWAKALKAFKAMEPFGPRWS